MQPINVALIGFGLGGRIFHAPFITQTVGFELKLIQTSNPKNIALAQKEYPTASIVSDYEAVLADSSILLIVLAIPNRFHFDYAQKALEAGKHVVVEKPFTVTSQEAKTLIELAQQQQKLLTVHHNRRWDSDFLTIKKVIANNWLGKLVEYEAHFDRFRNYIKPNAWKEEPEIGGGILYDLGSHLIDQALQLFGLPEAVFADLRAQRAQSEVIDNFEVILYYPQLKATLKASMLVRQDLPKFLLFGQEGTFVKHGSDPQEADLLANQRPTMKTNWGLEKEATWGSLNTNMNHSHFVGRIESEAGNYGLFYQNLYQAITKNHPLAVSPESARVVIKVIELAIQSHQSRKVIPFRD
ncbi:MAG: Gfo/Idh/MocA family oxidoreductase [Flammeovirgaceae bacterium]